MQIRPDVTPESPAEDQPAIGLIGMGAMGSLYARCLSEAGWKKWKIHYYVSICVLNGMFQDSYMRLAYQIRGFKREIRR